MVDYIKGLDVSIVQGNVNFQAIKDAGMQFVILRGYVGNNGLDADYNRFYQEATAANLYTATYNFPFPLPGTGTRTPQWQAQAHFSATKTPVHCIDVEWPTQDQWARWGCSAKQINDWFLTYLQCYEQLLGKKPVVYTYPDFARTVGFSQDWAQYPLWIASYQATPYIPKPWNDFFMWQTTGGGGKLPGSGVPVDTDVVKDLSLWNTPAAVEQPTPTPVVVDVPVPVIAPATLPPPVPPVVSAVKTASIMDVIWGVLKFLFHIKL